MTAAEKDKVFAVAQTDKGQGHIICDFAEVLTRGIGALRQQSADLLAQNPTNNFYQASCICMDALSAYVSRCERIVRSAAEEEAPADAHATIVLPRTPKRTAELQRLANILAHIATEPARDL